MFHAFFSHIVRVHDEGGNGLPRTPSSARKVQLTKSGSNASIASSVGGGGGKRNSSNRLSSMVAAASQLLLGGGPEPSADQRTVMSRLQAGRDPWQQLGLSPGCSREEVNRTYRRLAVMLHPDKTAVAGADKAFKTLGVARGSIMKVLGPAAV